MKKCVITIFIIGVSCMALGQVNWVKSIKIDTGECFIFARGTKSKQSFISKQFNLFYDSITHIGIGSRIDSVFKIYNVNALRNTNALTIESFESFANQTDLIYLGVWKLILNNVQKANLRKAIKGTPQYISFDYDFEIDTAQNKMYCSEYCWRITNAIGSDFSCKTTSRPLVELGLDKVLKRTTLTYVPVDYFLTFKSLEFVGSWRAEK